MEKPLYTRGTSVCTRKVKIIVSFIVCVVNESIKKCIRTQTQHTRMGHGTGMSYTVHIILNLFINWHKFNTSQWRSIFTSLNCWDLSGVTRINEKTNVWIIYSRFLSCVCNETHERYWTVILNIWTHLCLACVVGAECSCPLIWHNHDTCIPRVFFQNFILVHIR